MRDRSEITERLRDVPVNEEELAMAGQLIDGLAKPFEPSAYPNETRRSLLEFLEAKAAGQELAPPAEAPEPAPVVDLMAALKASLAAAGGGGAADAGAEEGAAEPEAERRAS
jgi:DNA end-binding protein Ku